MPRIDFDAVQSIIAEVSNEIILPRFCHLKTKDIAFKEADDPVTIADREAEAALHKRLAALLPGSRVLGEEAFAANPKLLDLFDGPDPVWIIDPIDGTKAFCEGQPTFGVIVALAVQNQTIAGWIYNPLTGDCVTAEKGSGAFRHGQRLTALPADDLVNMRGTIGKFVSLAFDTAEVRKREPSPHWVPIATGSHEYTQLVADRTTFAEGKPQIHFRINHHRGTPWDDAAGNLIHTEAGGYVAHWNGESVVPKAIGRGIINAPDVESWQKIRDWVAGFCPLPE